ncbi:MAG: carbohydrate ABC transporter permease [Atribacter sp.]|jgi:multiple sugar transport system permease protein|uniref:carbohydrate ABC transporter permease n=1 Tax=Atribacter sp. TaxID=2847780 RepID=UPI003D9812E6|nr:sugar ABC transporter permease [Atribacterota bacterium]
MIQLNKRFDETMLVLPATLFLILFSIYPLIFSFRLVFFKWFLNKPNPPSFIGLSNIQNVLLDARFWNSLKVTLIILLIAVTIETLAGLFLSLLFRDKVYGKRIIISLLMIPIMISPMVIGIIWRFILNPEIGIANYILKMVGLQPLIWLGDIKYALSTIILIDIWQWTPFLFIIFLSGMQGISPNLYEAAEVDGASEWGLIRYITIPMLKPIMYIGILIRSIDSFKMFDLVYILTRGGPVNSTETASLYIYKTGFNFFNMGKASTMSYILLIIMTFLIQRFIGKKEIV